MSRILFIVEPIPSGHSGQFVLFKKLSARLAKEHQVFLASIFFDEGKRRELESLGIKVITPERDHLFLQKLLSYFGKDNESMLWVESWLREGLLRKNSRELKTILKGEKFDYIINATNTVPIKAHIWWIQGPPLVRTLEDIMGDNHIVRLALLFGRSIIERVDLNITKRNYHLSSKHIANSKYCHQIYLSIGMRIDGIVYTSSGFEDFRPTTGSPSRDYVLAYIGKETELVTLIEMAEKGIKIIGFGSKLPIGANLETLRRMIDYRGFVSREELLSLYSNALFTAFPFTNEPFGYVPLESISCGTPVLTYNKQGPSETLVNGETGWLVNSSDEFVSKAVDIWKRGTTGIRAEVCVNAALPYSIENTEMCLLKFLNHS